MDVASLGIVSMNEVQTRRDQLAREGSRMVSSYRLVIYPYGKAT